MDQMIRDDLSNKLIHLTRGNSTGESYEVSCNIAAEKFERVRQAGGLVLEAANDAELKRTLDYVLTGKILAEQPPAPEPGLSPERAHPE